MACQTLYQLDQFRNIIGVETVSDSVVLDRDEINALNQGALFNSKDEFQEFLDYMWANNEYAQFPEPEMKSGGWDNRPRVLSVNDPTLKGSFEEDHLPNYGYSEYGRVLYGADEW